MTNREIPEATRPDDDSDDDRPLLARARGNNPAERPCLSCGEPFLSEGWHNRLCGRCAKRSQPADIYAAS
jgi:hypothetical protein